MAAAYYGGNQLLSPRIGSFNSYMDPSSPMLPLGSQRAGVRRSQFGGQRYPVNKTVPINYPGIAAIHHQNYSTNNKIFLPKGSKGSKGPKGSKGSKSTHNQKFPTNADDGFINIPGDEPASETSTTSIDSSSDSSSKLRVALAHAHAKQAVLTAQLQHQQQFLIAQQPAAAFPAMPGQQLNRTVYIGNLQPKMTVTEILDTINYGPIESVRFLPQKNCVFVSFLDASMAAMFHSQISLNGFVLHDVELKVGWGKPSSVPSNVLLAVMAANATRNVYLGALAEGTTEQQIRENLEPFGQIEHLRIIEDKHIAFVHFLSIVCAIKAVAQLPHHPNWIVHRVFYGKDRCGALRRELPASTGYYEDPKLLQGNRTIYLGNIHPDTTLEEICNTIRGGILHQIRYISEKHICFVTFVDAAAAEQLYAYALTHGIVVHNRRLKPGWGKHSGPLHSSLALAIASGASRNIYIGNVEDATLDEKLLRQIFSEWGEIELINSFKEKNCWFVNFTKIDSAIRVVEAAGLQQQNSSPSEQASLSPRDEILTKYRINFGKDRCANQPRPQQSSVNMHQSPMLVCENMHPYSYMFHQPVLSPAFSTDGSHFGNSERLKYDGQEIYASNDVSGAPNGYLEHYSDLSSKVCSKKIDKLEKTDGVYGLGLE